MAALLLCPPTGPIVLVALGLSLWRHAVTSRLLAWAGIASFVVFSMPLTSDALMAWFATTPIVTQAQLAQAQAIIIPGGGLTRDFAEFGDLSVATLTLERLRYGAVLARRSGLPVLVCGGSSNSSRATTEAQLMASVLTTEFGIKPAWIEASSRDTRENAQNSYAILSKIGVTRIALVGHGFDMRRALPEYRDAGFEVIAAPTGVANANATHVSSDFLPSLVAMQHCRIIFYELIGILARQVLRIDRP